MRLLISTFLNISLLVVLMSCSENNKEFERVPDSWFTIEPILLGFEEYDLCYELFVREDFDQYSIGRENECLVHPGILQEEERGDIIIRYDDTTIRLREIEGKIKAFYTEFENEGMVIGSPSKWYSTIDSSESLKWVEGISYEKIEINELIIDFRKDFLTREFFDSIKINKDF